MRHRVKITVLDTTLNEELQRRYLANPESGVCPCFKKGDSFDFWREEDRDDFYKFGVEKPFPCAEAWDCISRYVYTGLQGGAGAGHPLWFSAARWSTTPPPPALLKKGA